MAEVDLDKVRMLAESAERRARELHFKYGNECLKAAHAKDGVEAGSFDVKAASLLNDFFYWSGKATSYRGIVAMCELATIVEDELDAEASCP